MLADHDEVRRGDEESPRRTRHRRLTGASPARTRHCPVTRLEAPEAGLLPTAFVATTVNR